MKVAPQFGRKIAMGVLAGLLLGGFGFVVARSGPLAPTRVTTATVAHGEVATALFGIGTVEARRSYLIGPTVAGRVARVQVDVGEAVKAGQLLAEIEPVDLDERLRAGEAARARAAAALSAAEAQRVEAHARLALAESNLRRYEDLAARQFVSASALDDRRQALESGRAAFAASHAGVRGARDELTRLQAESDGLQRQRDTLRLRAPRDGVVTGRDAEAGSTVTAGQAVIRMIEPDSLWVRVRLDQGRARGLAVGQAADIVLRSDAAVRLPGRVARIEPVSDSVTEERIALVGFGRQPAGLGIGEMAEVTIHTGTTRPGPIVPNAAIRQTPEGPAVWRLNAGEPALVPVTLGDTGLDGAVQVLAGVAVGDEIVVHSERALAAGARIRVVGQLTDEQP